MPTADEQSHGGPQTISTGCPYKRGLPQAQGVPYDDLPPEKEAYVARLREIMLATEEIDVDADDQPILR